MNIKLSGIRSVGEHFFSISSFFFYDSAEIHARSEHI